MVGDRHLLSRHASNHVTQWDVTAKVTSIVDTVIMFGLGQAVVECLKLLIVSIE